MRFLALYNASHLSNRISFDYIILFFLFFIKLTVNLFVLFFAFCVIRMKFPFHMFYPFLLFFSFPYCTIGKVSIYSQSGDSIDMLLSVGGLSIDKFTMKIFQINTCLYLTKGMAEYVNVLEIDEFFIPQGKHFNYADVLKTAELGNTVNQANRENEEKNDFRGRSDNNISSKKTGIEMVFAAEQAHPACFFSVYSEVFMNKNSDDRSNPWIGERYVRFSVNRDTIFRLILSASVYF